MTYKTKVREAVLEKCASINRNTLWKGACPQPRQTSKFSVPVGLSFWRGQGDGIIFFLTSPLVCIHFLPNNILSYSIGISTISTLFSLSLSSLCRTYSSLFVMWICMSQRSFGLSGIVLQPTSLWSYLVPSWLFDAGYKFLVHWPSSVLLFRFFCQYCYLLASFFPWSDMYFLSIVPTSL